jgi:protein ImuA
MSMNLKLEILRQQIRSIEGHGLATQGHRVLPFHEPRLNALLPGGGLQLGALHEFCSSGLEGELASTVTAFAGMIAAHILRNREGFILWAASQADCYLPGLARLGLSPSRIVWIDCAKDAEVLSVMEEALHSCALAAVLGEAGSLTLKTGRRLDAAARQSGTTALLLRRHRSKPSKPGEAPSGAAATRWRVSAVPGPYRHPGNARDVIRDLKELKLSILIDPRYRQAVSGMMSEEPGLGPPRWRLGLDYCRNGRTASWIVEACHGAGGDNAQASHVRVVAELRNDARASEEAPARETAGAARSA